MAYDPDPTSILPGIRFRSTDGAGALTVAAGLSKNYILIDKADLPKHDSGDDADVGRLLLALADGIYQGFNDLALADRPTQFLSALSSGSTGDSTMQRTYVFQFNTGIVSEEVLSE